MPPTALIAYEDTPQGRDGVALGRLLCEAVGAVPLLATVFPWPPGFVGPEDLEAAVKANTATHFDAGIEILSGLEPRTRASVDQSVGLGLIELSRAEDARLLVFGSCHRGSVGRTLLGSTVESAPRRGRGRRRRRPLGYAERPRDTPARIAVAYEGSPESEVALSTAIGLADRWNAHLSLLGVADYPRYDYAEAWTMLSGGGLHDFEREAHYKTLRRGLARAKERVAGSMRLLTGSPGPMVAGVSAEFDLLVAGSRGHGPARRTLLGSTTRRLMAKSSCPVLVTPREAGPDPLALEEA